jgi:hypothetical protein
MHAMRTLVSLAALLVVSTAALAQTDYVLRPRGLTNVTFGRSVVGEFSRHALPDVVVLATGMQNGTPRATAVLLTAPSIHHSAVPLRGTENRSIRDVAVVRRGDPDQRRDALAMTTDDGLYLWTFDGTMTRHGGPNWLNATRIEVGDPDGDSVPDAIGRMGDAFGGNPQNLRFQPLSGAAGTWFVNTLAPVFDHVVVDWSTNAGGTCDEVAVVQADHVRFVKDGILDVDATETIPECVDARIVAIGDGLGGRCLVVGATDSNGISTLITLERDGTRWSKVLPHPLASLTAVDRGAGAGGVVVAFHATANPLHYTFDRTHGSEGFGTGTSIGIDLGSNIGAADARVLDLDADGDLDAIGSATSRGGVFTSTTPGGSDYVTLSGELVSGGNAILYSFSGAPAWANEIEAVHFTLTAEYDAEAELLLDVDLVPLSPGRARMPANSTFTFPESAPFDTLGPTGGLVTLYRHVRVENGLVVQRGPFSPRVWSRDATVLSFLTAEIGNLLNGSPPGSHPHQNPGGASGAITPPKVPPPDDPPDDPPDGGDQGGGGGGG